MLSPGSKFPQPSHEGFRLSLAQKIRPQVPFFDNPKMDLNPRVVEFPKTETHLSLSLLWASEKTEPCPSENRRGPASRRGSRSTSPGCCPPPPRAPPAPAAAPGSSNHLDRVGTRLGRKPPQATARWPKSPNQNVSGCNQESDDRMDISTTMEHGARGSSELRAHRSFLTSHRAT